MTTVQRPSGTRQIPLSRPFFGDEERLAVVKPLESGWVVQGPFVREFEQKFAEFVATPNAVAMSSCTTAMHAAVLALGLRPDDEVIVPAFTWIATANVVEAVGARPIFCDIDLATFNIDPSAAASLVTSRTVGIIPVHLFGLSADLDPLLALARQHGLWVMEDAACALGARYRGQHVGTFGAIGCFSFHPRKSITTGDGGMAISDDAGLASRLRSLRDHGVSERSLGSRTDPAWMPDFAMLGFNYRMTDIQGAIGSVQMDRASWILAERLRCADHYRDALAEDGWLHQPTTPEGYEHGFQAYVCRVGADEPSVKDVATLKDERDRLIASLADRGIGSRPGTHAPPLTSFYREKYGIKPGDVPNAAIAEASTLALPLFAGMSENDLDYVVAGVHQERRSS